MLTRPTTPTPTPTQQPAVAVASPPLSPAVWKEAGGYIEKDGEYYAIAETLHQQELADLCKDHADELAALEQAHAAALKQMARDQVVAAVKHVKELRAEQRAHKATKQRQKARAAGQAAEIVALRRRLAAAEQRACSAAQAQEDDQRRRQHDAEQQQRQLAAANQRAMAARAMGLQYIGWYEEADRQLGEGRQALVRKQEEVEQQRARADALAKHCGQLERMAEGRSAVLECAAQNLRDRLASITEDLETARAQIREGVEQCELQVRMGERRSETLECAAQNLRDRLAMANQELGHQETTITDLRALLLQALDQAGGCEGPTGVLMGYLRRAINLIETRNVELKRLQEGRTSD